MLDSWALWGVMGVIPFMARPTKDESVQAKSRSISLSPKEWEAVDAVVANEYTNNRSAYFAELVAGDLSRRSFDADRERLRQKFEELVAAIGQSELEERLGVVALAVAKGAA
jgi:hypothetical protein